MYTFLGESDQALDRLERDCDRHELDPPFLRDSPQFDPLRSDPRFQALLRRMNLLL